ncbi:acetolactate synthase large subunit [Conexibacter woesei]|uniref:Thiamine pyrophosphate protein TPP binding domain protein n=1 Tax=Conexibacter woesei (strain DSM 14684 / CCUG 47730 / CIP 108061 / JCM 11494 / NBRC 100937 / ID131577) TaxID=469383 RepID=D3F2X6_CONWI|nr:acetolactate synthase large subunit [Conexibacter woesei]ADB54257.1 thiamine pyrophosphate protein TPP binding domain protein [Conexibacter woesei DSM 14684]
MPARRRASDLFVECLEAEGVQYVFGIPGEETLDLSESLEDSSVQFVPVRHEQGGAYMADMYGRLTGRAGVCLGTLGPGATNLITAVADAYLDRAPLVALTGQADVERMHKESHQYIDLVQILRPVVKWNARVSSPDIVPEVVRKAFKLAEAEKPGATHLELPEDVMAAAVDDADVAASRPLPRQQPVRTEPRARDLLRAAEIIRAAKKPVALAGNGVVRGGAAPALREFSRATGIKVAETFMAKGVVDADSANALGTVGLQARDYALAGFEDADVVIAIGYDLVEHAPKHWNPRRDKQIVVIDTVPAEIDANFVPDVELIGDIYGVLARLADECRDTLHTGGSQQPRELVRGRLGDAATDDAFPAHPPRALLEIRKAMGRDDILISDVGLHKLWIGRMFPAHEPNTVMIANGLAGMGFAVPSAIGAKLVHPERKVVTVSGDGGFLMNCQELETAVRLRTPFVNVIWENRQYGSIVWKQDKKFGRHFGVDFTNPDFVMLAESFGLPAWRAESIEDFAARFQHALTLDVPSLIVLPIDYSPDVALTEQLGTETVAT